MGAVSKDTRDSLPLEDQQIADLKTQCERAGVSISGNSLRQFSEYAGFIKEWNKRSNIVSNKDVSRIASRHLFESLLLTKAADLSGSIRLLDIGSGAGFPGIPLKIWNPEIELTAIEPDRKKALFIETVVERLNLKNTEILCERAESDSTVKQKAEIFDVITARAVAPLSTLLDWAKPYLKRKGGVCLFPKGSNLKNEFEKVTDIDWNLSTLDLSHEIPEKHQTLLIVTAVLSIS